MRGKKALPLEWEVKNQCNWNCNWKFPITFYKNAKIQIYKGHLRDKPRTSKGHETDISDIITLSNQNRGKLAQSQTPSQSHFKISITYFSKMSVYLYLVCTVYFIVQLGWKQFYKTVMLNKPSRGWKRKRIRLMRGAFQHLTN